MVNYFYSFEHWYDTGCPNYKVYTYELCQGYSLGYKTKWNSLTGETTTQQQSQAQAQGGSNVHVDGNHNNIIIAPKQTEKQSSSGSESDIDSAESSNYK